MDVEATRKALGLSRKELATKAGVTESAVWSVEHGKNPRGGEEIRQAVLAALDPMAKPAETVLDSPPASSNAPAGQPSGSRGGKKVAQFPTERPDWTYRFEWNGLLPGDPCKVNGETGVAKFHQHVVTDGGHTHITVWLDGAWRSFDPDRVVPSSRTKKRGPGDGTNGSTDWILEVLSLAGQVHSLPFATYRDARDQMQQHEVPAGGKCKIKNYLGTVVEVAPKGWADTVSEPQEVTV